VTNDELTAFLLVSSNLSCSSSTKDIELICTLASNFCPADVGIEERSDEVTDDGLMVVDCVLVSFDGSLDLFFPEVGHDTGLSVGSVSDGA
jgi:hypothetical protein